MFDQSMPSLEYLFDCSVGTLQEIELKMLDLASQAEKRAKQELTQAVSYRGKADIFRFLIEQRSDMIDLAKLVVDGKQRLLRFKDIEQLEWRDSA